MADKEKEVCGRKPRRLEELNLLDNDCSMTKK